MNYSFIGKKSIVFVLLALAYTATGKFGLSLAEISPSISTVWAPTGIALAALLYFGYQYWPAIFVGAFIINVTTTNDVTSSAIIAVGNTLEALSAAYLINRFAGGKYFYNKSSTVKNFIFLVGAAAAVSATIGVAALTLTGFNSWFQTSQAWIAWWLGDLSGAIIITPLLLLIADTKLETFNKGQTLERILFLVCVFGVCLAVFGNTFANHPLGFLLIPLLLWPGIRFSQREAAITTFIITAITIIATVQGTGSFLRIYPEDTMLMLQAYLGVIALTSLILAAAVAERNATKARLAMAYDHALEGWSTALDLRDKETEGHAIRVADLSVRLAARMGLGKEKQGHIRRGALLHDIGKMAIPDNILYKPGPLTEEEWVVMRKHPLYAAEFLSKLSYSSSAKDIPYCHHEKYDGTGYPNGLKGKDIPLTARIFAVADVWDAMRSNRPYRTALSDKEVIEHMSSLAGKHFDPTILKVFIEMAQEESAEIPQSPNHSTEFKAEGTRQTVGARE